MNILDLQSIKEINYDLTDLKQSNLDIGSVYSSIDYYSSIFHKISSIVRSIIKNHYFVDGNKRTATIVLLYLIELNNIEVKISQEIDEIIVDIAINNYSVEEISKKIFGR